MTESRARAMTWLGWRGGAWALSLSLAAGCAVGDEAGPGFGFTTANVGSSATASGDDTGDDGDEPPPGSGTSGAHDDGGWPGDADEGGDETGEPPAGPLGSCCEPSEVPGCATPGIEACVCQADPTCCQNAWTASCAKRVESLGCGKCPGNDPPPPPAGDCCQANGTPGCVDAAVEACVCAQDPDCCQSDWDAFCVQGVEALGCGTCGGGGGGNPAPAGCCMPQPGPGCGDGFVEFCVCITDPYCCVVEWDAQCVAEVTEFGCGSC
jgi:hypothetical protein